jgi:hypothetical protein
MSRSPERGSPVGRDQDSRPTHPTETLPTVPSPQHVQTVLLTRGVENVEERLSHYRRLYAHYEGALSNHQEAGTRLERVRRDAAIDALSAHLTEIFRRANLVNPDLDWRLPPSEAQDRIVEEYGNSAGPVAQRRDLPTANTPPGRLSPDVSRAGADLDRGLMRRPPWVPGSTGRVIPPRRRTNSESTTSSHHSRSSTLVDGLSPERQTRGRRR